MKVLVADTFPAEGLERLRAAGCEVECNPKLSGATLTEAVRGSAADVLVVRSTEVRAETLLAGRLGLVVRAGAGYNTIDVKQASELGIYVANCPGKNSVAVAELTFALILAIDRHVVDAAVDLRRGVWNKAAYGKSRGLLGRRLAVLGVGSIGREVIGRAHAFGLRVSAWSRSLDEATAAELGVTRCADPVAAAAGADIVSVHLALKPETRGLVGESVFAAMRPGAYFINTARAEIVVEEALLAAVRNRGLLAAVDVFAGEPAASAGSVESPLFREPGIIGTHHIGASTEQAQDAIAEETVRIVLEYERSGRAPNCVNVASRTPATHILLVRHRDRVGVLAHVFAHLRGAGINVEETDNIVFEGASAAMASLHLSAAPSEPVLAAIRAGSEDVLELSLKRL